MKTPFLEHRRLDALPFREIDKAVLTQRRSHRIVAFERTSGSPVVPNPFCVSGRGSVSTMPCSIMGEPSLRTPLTVALNIVT